MPAPAAIDLAFPDPVTPAPAESRAPLEQKLEMILSKLRDTAFLDRFYGEGELRQREDVRGGVRFLLGALRSFGALPQQLLAAETLTRMSGGHRATFVAWAHVLEQAGQLKAAAVAARIALTIFYDDVHTQKLFLRCGGGTDFHANAKDRFCANPFENFEIYVDGSVFICNCIEIPFAVGNIFKQDVMEIWQSPQAQAIRASILDGSFRFCSPLGCWKRFNLPKRSEQPEKFERLKKIGVGGSAMPRNFNLSYDCSCNLSCPSCRPHLFMANREERAKQEIIRDKAVLPLLADKNAAIVYITGSGDAFGSPHFRNLLKQLCDPKFEHVQITLGTNGQLITPRLWEEIRPLHARFNDITISIDSATPATYERLRRGSTWERLQQSMGILSSARRAGAISRLIVNMVVQKDNFLEMRQVIALCKNWAVDGIRLYRLRQWGHTSPAVFADLDVSDPMHPRHGELLAEFSHPDFLDPIITRYDLYELIEQVHQAKPAPTA